MTLLATKHFGGGVCTASICLHSRNTVDRFHSCHVNIEHKLAQELFQLKDTLQNSCMVRNGEMFWMGGMHAVEKLLSIASRHNNHTRIPVLSRKKVEVPLRCNKA